MEFYTPTPATETEILSAEIGNVRPIFGTFQIRQRVTLRGQCGNDGRPRSGVIYQVIKGDRFKILLDGGDMYTAGEAEIESALENVDTVIDALLAVGNGATRATNPDKTITVERTGRGHALLSPGALAELTATLRDCLADIDRTQRALRLRRHLEKDQPDLYPSRATGAAQ